MPRLMTKEELKNRVLNYGRGSGKSLRFLIEIYENRIVELERKLEQTEKDLADYQFNYPKIKELEKENAELKSRLNAINLLTPELEKSSKLKKQQLTKAIGIIKRWYETNRSACIEPSQELIEVTEQFIKEI